MSNTTPSSKGIKKSLEVTAISRRAGLQEETLEVLRWVPELTVTNSKGRRVLKNFSSGEVALSYWTL